MKVYYTILLPSGRSLRPLQNCTSTTPPISSKAISDARVFGGVYYFHTLTTTSSIQQFGGSARTRVCVLVCLWVLLARVPRLGGFASSAGAAL